MVFGDHFVSGTGTTHGGSDGIFPKSNNNAHQQMQTHITSYQEDHPNVDTSYSDEWLKLY